MLSIKLLLKIIDYLIPVYFITFHKLIQFLCHENHPFNVFESLKWLIKLKVAK